MRDQILGRRAEPFTRPSFGLIVQQWSAWKRGISPTRQAAGRGAQNPYLLMAFGVLDRAESDGTSEAHREMNRR